MRRIKGVTLVEVMVGLALVSWVLLIAIQIVLSIYKANIYVTTLLALEGEVTYATGFLKSVLRNADPGTVVCDAGFRDFNGDGVNDYVVVEFELIDGKRIALVQVRNLINPLKNSVRYNSLILFRFNEQYGRYDAVNKLFTPQFTVREVQIRCSPLIDRSEKGYALKGINMRFLIDSVVSYRDLMLRGDTTPVVEEYPAVVSFVIQN